MNYLNKISMHEIKPAVTEKQLQFKIPTWIKIVSSFSDFPDYQDSDASTKKKQTFMALVRCFLKGSDWGLDGKNRASSYGEVK